jgi:iron-sulfur cluster insertion protein
VTAIDNGNFVVDSMSVMYVAGTEIDYVKEAFGSQFVIRNPNATSSCGCGESFSV